MTAPVIPITTGGSSPATVYVTMANNGATGSQSSPYSFGHDIYSIGGTAISGGTMPVSWTGQSVTVSGTPTVNIASGQSVSISGSVAVTGTFWQTTQPISAASLPLPGNAAQETGGNLATIAGAVTSNKIQANITNSSLPVTGTFWQTTQPISAASLPLPTGAALETGGNLATIAGAVSSNKIQANITNSSLPVTGTFWQTTQPVSIASAIVTNADGSISGGTAGSKSLAIGGVYNTSLPTLTNGQQSGIQLDSSGRQLVTIANSSIAVTGTFYQSTQPISAASLPLPSNAAQESGGNLATIAGAVSSGKIQIYQPGTTPTAGTQTASATASALNSGTSLACSAVFIQADPGNAVNLKIGTSASQPIALTAGSNIVIPCSNVNQVYIYAATGSPVANWVSVS